jgi:hypothetical protein
MREASFDEAYEDVDVADEEENFSVKGGGKANKKALKKMHEASFDDEEAEAYEDVDAADEEEEFSVKEAKTKKTLKKMRSASFDETREHEEEEVEEADIALDASGIPVPEFRYQMWDDLSEEMQLHATILGYDEHTWNYEEINPIETFSYEQISEAEHAHVALVALGFTKESWNCYMNHYDSMHWEDIEANEVASESWTTLGWDKESWVGEHEVPESEDMHWKDLSEEQRAAAAQACYVEESWEMVPFEEWTELVGAPEPEAAGEEDEDERAANIDEELEDVDAVEEEHSAKADESKKLRSASLGEASEDLEEASEDLEEASEDLEEASKDLEEASKALEEASKDLEEASHDYPEAEEAEEVEAEVDIAIDASGVPVPYFRYQLWEDLSMDMQHYASVLGYDEKTWNYEKINPLEAFGFDQISEKAPAAIVPIVALGFTKETWNCYMNHYDAQEWDYVSESFAQLGWDEESWEGETELPETEEMEWKDLSDEQRAAAAQACYVEESWDMVPLDEWNELPVAPEEESMDQQEMEQQELTTVDVSDYPSASPVSAR